MCVCCPFSIDQFLQPRDLTEEQFMNLLSTHDPKYKPLSNNGSITEEERERLTSALNVEVQRLCDELDRTLFVFASVYLAPHGLSFKYPMK